MRKLLSKSLLAIAVTSMITACSTVDLYPKNQVDSSIIKSANENKYSQVEVILTDTETKQTEVLIYDLVRDRLSPQAFNGNLGNKSINLRISIEDCQLCAGTDMQVQANIRTQDIIQVTSVESKDIEVIEIPSIEHEPMVDKSDKIADTTPVSEEKQAEIKASTSIDVADSLIDGEEVIESTEFVVTPTVVQSPAVEAPVVIIPTEKVVSAEFTPPQGVKPFLYKGESDEMNRLFTNATHMMQRPLQQIGDNYTDVIANEVYQSNNTTVHTTVPVTVKVRLIPVPVLDLSK